MQYKLVSWEKKLCDLFFNSAIGKLWNINIYCKPL